MKLEYHLTQELAVRNALIKLGWTPPTPPADAPEPPWVVACNSIVNEIGHTHPCFVRFIREACEQHTAALAQERDALRIEYESRALWIAEMNRILGYDNSDGFHSEPDPHTLARQLVAEWAKGKDERETLRATVGRLTAERDEAIAERNELRKIVARIQMKASAEYRDEQQPKG